MITLRIHQFLPQLASLQVIVSHGSGFINRGRSWCRFLFRSNWVFYLQV